MYKLAGIIKVVNPTIQVSDKFSKREFVVSDISGMYPQDILFQLSQDKCSLLDGIIPGDKVDVSFNIRGREWINPQGEVRYFNSLDAWRIEKEGASTQAPSNNHVQNTTPTPSAIPENSSSNGNDDDLPF